MKKKVPKRANTKNPRKKGEVLSRSRCVGDRAHASTKAERRRTASLTEHRKARVTPFVEPPLAVDRAHSGRTEARATTDYGLIYRSYCPLGLIPGFSPTPKAASKTRRPFFPVATYYLSRSIRSSAAFLSASVFESLVICQSPSAPTLCYLKSTLSFR